MRYLKVPKFFLISTVNFFEEELYAWQRASGAAAARRRSGVRSRAHVPRHEVLLEGDPPQHQEQQQEDYLLLQHQEQQQEEHP
jgi:hypothetical protein